MKSINNEIHPQTTIKPVPKKPKSISNCERTVIDVSYPKMYFRNDLF